MSHITADVKYSVSYSTTTLALPSTATGLQQTTGTGGNGDVDYDDIVSNAHSRRPPNLYTQRHAEVAINTDEYEEYEGMYISYVILKSTTIHSLLSFCIEFDSATLNIKRI